MSRTEQLNARLTEKECKAIDDAARKAGISAGEFIRNAALAAASHCPLCGKRTK